MTSEPLDRTPHALNLPPWVALCFVYILADFRRGRTYIGVTNNLLRRVYEHREGLVPGYTERLNIKRLVYFEEHGEIGSAIQRETSLKRWYTRMTL